MSRTKLYGSVSELAGDSSAVVRVQVRHRTTETSAGPVDVVRTLVTADVEVALAPRSLAAEVGSVDDLRSGDVIVVRQVDSPDMGSGRPAPVLEPGKRYLLFLTRSGLEGEAGEHFFVTGGVAGIYREGPPAPSRDEQTYVRAEVESGDILPDTLTLDRVERA